MTFTAYASSSSGNFYTLSDGGTRLIVECGLRFAEMQRLLDFRTADFDACLITHEHADHSRSAAHVADCGVPICASRGTLAALRHAGRCAELADGRPFRVGSLDILPFAAVHDAAEPLGFFIRSRRDGESMMFATDTAALTAKMAGLAVIAVECNHDAALLDADGTLCPKVRRRIINNHLSVGACEKYISGCDLSVCREIMLLHLSGGHSDVASFASRVSRAAHGRVRVSVCPKLV